MLLYAGGLVSIISRATNSLLVALALGTAVLRECSEAGVSWQRNVAAGGQSQGYRPNAARSLLLEPVFNCQSAHTLEFVCVVVPSWFRILVLAWCGFGLGALAVASPEFRVEGRNQN